MRHEMVPIGRSSGGTVIAQVISVRAASRARQPTRNSRTESTLSCVGQSR